LFNLDWKYKEPQSNDKVDNVPADILDFANKLDKKESCQQVVD
tara:strand:+ start:888 stop:1016 length:129 start_codon:yes stop_codon:yes gene_type:complete